MLNLDMRRVISLLKEIDYMKGYAVREQSLPELSRLKASKLLEQLLRDGLLHVIDSSSEDPLLFRYALCRPIQEITLYDILRVTGGALQLSLNDAKKIDGEYGFADRRLRVLESMIYRFLSEIYILEVTFSRESEGGVNIEKEMIE